MKKPDKRNLIQIWLLSAAVLQAVNSGAQTVTNVAAGMDHSLFLKSDGSLWAMGYDNDGQLGDRDAAANNINSSTDLPEQIVSSGVVAIAAGAAHSLLLKTNGSLWAMGDDQYGQLGDGSPDYEQTVPEQIVSTNVTAIAAGYGHSLFIKSDGSLWAMGFNRYGGLGDGTFATNSYWGTNKPEQIVTSSVTAISGGGGHSLFLKSNGSLWAMGENDSGQLGDGTTNNVKSPEQIVASGVTAIAAGYGHSLFLKSNGSLWAMGANYYGQLGDGTTNNVKSPEQIVASGVTAIAAGGTYIEIGSGQTHIGGYSLFLKSDGSLWAMGENDYGQLGVSDNYQTNRPVQILTSNITAIAAGGWHTLIISNNGSLWATGLNYYGQLGDGTFTFNVAPPEQIIGLPIIRTQPANQTAGVGSNVTFSVTATAGALSLFYQWFNTNNAIDNQTNSTLTLQNVQLTEPGSSYFVVITNSFGSVTSSVANLTVQQYAPAIATQPIGGNVPEGSNFTFNVSATGTTLAYQWQNDSGIIAGANASNLTLSNLDVTNSGFYSVIITNLVESITSSVAILDVGYPPVVIQQPASVTPILGGTASFNCVVTGTPPIVLQWLENGTVLTGQTNTTLTLTNIQLPITTIQLSAINNFGVTLSSNAAINVSFSSFPSFPSNLYSGLVAYYPFNQNANDASGNGNNGTVNGAVLTTDRFRNSNGAYSFDGVSSYISFNSVPLNQTDNWTITIWIQLASLNQLGSVVTMGYDDGSSANGFAFDIAGVNTGFSGNIFLGVFGGVTSIDSGYSFASSNQWYQVVMLRDSGVTEFFVNGFQTVNTSSGITPNPPTSFTIGSATGTRFFSGSISDVRIYNRSLSSNEVLQLYNYESGNLPPKNLSASPNGNNALQLQFFGTPNYPYIIQATTNLTLPSWQAVVTNNTDVYGNWIFTDTNAINYPARFYRLQLQ